VAIGDPGSLFNVFVGAVWVSITDIFTNRGGKKYGFLSDDTDERSKMLDVEVRYFNTINFNRALE
jgi:hypothetical protein